MGIMDSLKKFINEVIFKKEPQKLITSAIETEDLENHKINLAPIENYLKQDKYAKNLTVSIGRIDQSTRKALFKKIGTQIQGSLNNTHDDTTLVEGMISGRSFISVRRRDVPENKVGETIITENGYIDISTRKKMNENRYSNLLYIEDRKRASFEERYQYDEVNERYSRKIRNANIVFSESAIYATKDELITMESYAQPSNENRALQEYTKITKLSYIASEEKYNIANTFKISPYLVTIEACVLNKNGELSYKKSINKIFKSKKECIVGYRPEMILLDGFSGCKMRMFRLLPEGLYVDNETFKPDFEGKYSIKKISLEEIEALVTELPFVLSQETKKILRNGLEIPNHIKTIYDIGLDQIHIRGLDAPRKTE